MSAEIIAAPVPSGSKEIPGPTHVVLQIVAFQPIECKPATGEISAVLASDKEIDDAVAHLISQAEKAGRAAKKILLKNKVVVK